MPWLSLEAGNRCWYEDHGTGFPLVLIHGWCMSSAVWRLQFEGLSDLFRIIALDLPGHGKSPVDMDGFSRAACSEVMAALFATLDLRDTLLAGWSLGSMLAIEAFPQVRDRLSGLVLIGGTPRFTQCNDFPSGLSSVEVTGMAQKIKRSLRRALDGFTGRMFAGDELTDPAHTALVQEILSSVPLPSTEVALQALQVLHTIDLRDRLHNINLPTLVMCGDRDTICLPQASDFLANNIVQSRYKGFSGCGHAPFLSKPLYFNACLKEFGRMLTSGH